MAASTRANPVARLDENRCVHERIAMATCRACADACPFGAVEVKHRTVEVNESRCDGCGLCAAACPTGAIAVGRSPVETLPRSGTSAFIACGACGAGTATGVVPCANSLDWRAIAALHERGIREIVIARGSCDGCTHRGPLRIEAGIEQVNAASLSRGRPGISMRPVDARTWRTMSGSATLTDGISPARRTFLRRIFALDPEAQRGSLPPATDVALSTTGGRTFVHAHVPAIDSERCDGCDACARLCPTGALLLDDLGPRHRYVIDPSRCDGCGICADACGRDAVTVSSWSTTTQHEVPLVRARCPQCGTGHHAPYVGAGGQCRACMATHSQRKGLRIVMP